MEASSEARKDVSPPPVLLRGNGETVLIVDDEEPVLAVTRQTLEAFGYRTLIAHNGKEAVAIYAQHREEISAVLCDMVMPVMDGPATIRSLKKTNPAIKIAVASGSASIGTVTQDFSAEIKHFLPKPYTAGTLLKMLRTLLDEEVNCP
jgi:CheY-like chemotaxis protein